MFYLLLLRTVRQSASGTTDLVALGFNPMNEKINPVSKCQRHDQYKGYCALRTHIGSISVIALRFYTLSLLYIGLKPDATYRSSRCDLSAVRLRNMTYLEDKKLHTIILSLTIIRYIQIKTLPQ
jgi:hypothetical protein